MNEVGGRDTWRKPSGKPQGRLVLKPGPTAEHFHTYPARLEQPTPGPCGMARQNPRGVRAATEPLGQPKGTELGSTSLQHRDDPSDMQTVIVAPKDPAKVISR